MSRETASNTPPPRRFVLSHRYTVKCDAFTKISESRTCSGSHVSVNAIMWAEHESIALDKELCLFKMLLMLVKSTETRGVDGRPLPLAFTYGDVRGKVSSLGPELRLLEGSCSMLSLAAL